MARPLGHQEALSKAAKFCSLRERSPNEVRLKLSKWKCEEGQIQEIIAYLIDQGYIDSRRFAVAYCHDKFEFYSWGKLKIKAHIFNHKIDNQDVEFGLSQIDDGAYYEKLKKLTVNKLNQLKEGDSLKKPKTIKYLMSKGFEYELAIEVVNEII